MPIGTITEDKGICKVMILTVTINPLLERRLIFNSIKKGKVNRSLYETFGAGGKGINVSRQLGYLNIKNLALSFIGGGNGKTFRKTVAAEKINTTFINIKNDIRWASIIVEKKSKTITSFFSPNFEVSQLEVDNFKSKLEKMIPNCSIVIFSGSSPCENANSIIPFGILIANKYNKISIADTYGTHLEETIFAAPTVLHNNIKEIEKSLKLDLQHNQAKVEFLNYIYSKGIKLGYLTDGANSFYASKFDFHYKVTPPKIILIDETGSGDAFVAGVAEGLEKGLTFEEFTQNAVMIGAANAESFDTCKVKRNEIKLRKNEIKIEPIGKKIKIVDDTPNY